VGVQDMPSSTLAAPLTYAWTRPAYPAILIPGLRRGCGNFPSSMQGSPDTFDVPTEGRNSEEEGTRSKMLDCSPEVQTPGASGMPCCAATPAYDTTPYKK